MKKFVLATLIGAVQLQNTDQIVGQFNFYCKYMSDDGVKGCCKDWKADGGDFNALA